ncbi:biotin--[acetyl-CoA-carboxylase] ligase [Dysgonomonas macrotermitis]|uniref:BirA family transcriptional regulator, biotin operon repressor / biotin-[acetyl-CoA-carboxylase] ligase n=1 Tax=Dysgonomonas macrotermitis TaxID=1346286 RepID=A0A1M4ZK04_9BACT|nr:biotin--[acetyl-CoA-carboxylase] ligase [Dysgonomonas macrotermitis]SHF18142.1 BirA family transcriptional regulator, biotin operon repressor / biotin-[acetyl-CoA-carboxylase] ligase [Dysgonomonas macrotermitis]
MPEAKILHIEETESTNLYLRKLSEEKTLPNGFSVYSDFQTAGRGQRGNSWESEKGLNLTFSTILYPVQLKAENQFLISQIVSLSIYDTLSEYTDGISIKWPNDIYWKDRKITGMLIENDIMGDYISKSIIGVGVNLNQDIFKSDAPNPVSLKQITHKTCNIESVLISILEKLSSYYKLLNDTAATHRIRDTYKDALFRKNGLYKFADAEGFFFARIKNVKDIGLLCLETETGEIRNYGFKEVRYILD